ncbi:hypothetical protein [Mycobacterium scrofulaceum]|uniref:hypothetical protein n=1 Tax=Mycobacterium scrofulaceum TaxID=1783 RepID=UPI00114E6457|nr:hypothetical protein [Mycobacterium scrofulaceum]
MAVAGATDPMGAKDVQDRPMSEAIVAHEFCVMMRHFCENGRIVELAGGSLLHRHWLVIVDIPKAENLVFARPRALRSASPAR